MTKLSGLRTLICAGVALQLCSFASTALPVSAETTEATGARATTEDPISGVWKGRFSHPEWDFGVYMVMHMSRDQSVQGCITWTLVRANAPEVFHKIGFKAAEYVYGSYDPATRALKLDGFVMDDPNKLQIGLDSHDLHLSRSGRSIAGHSGYHSDGHDYFKVVRSNEKEQEPIVIRAQFNEPVERLWRYFTDASYLKTWLTKDAKVGSKPGEPYELFWDTEHPERNSTQGCLITAYAPEKYLGFNWRGPLRFAAVMNSDPPPTYVTVRFDKIGENKTAVTLRHDGWGGSPLWQEAREWQTKAWQSALSELKDRTEER